MRIWYAELGCSGRRPYIDCLARRCPFCTDYINGDWQEKDVSPSELLQLIRSFQYIIKSISV